MRRATVLLFVLILLLAGMPAALRTAAQAGNGAVVVAEVEGVINPLSTRYVTRVLSEASAEGAEAVVLVLNTPGGLESSMREIVEAMLASSVPVVVYVAPDGARATSAGMFITLAGHIAAMAPGTHMGAAHPVPLGATADEVMNEKMVSDAAAFAQSIAQVRGRNTDWPAAAVRENSSLLASEALEQDVIDLIATDMDDLLQQIDGRQVTIGESERTLETAAAPRQEAPMRWAERLVHVITHPDIAYLLITLGTLLLLAELAEPGLGVGGVGSAVAFLLAFVALGSLPINWAGAAFLLVALVMFMVALLTDADFIVMASALIPFVLGSLMLYSPLSPSSPAAPDLRVSPWLIVIMSLAILGFTVGVLRAILGATRLAPQSGAERLVGMRGLALTALNPHGQVRVDLQQWSAVSVGDLVAQGQEIVVVGVTGVRLQVTPVDDQAAGG